MKNLYCESCGARVYFQNSRCLSCEAEIGFELLNSEMVSLESEKGKAAYKRCKNGIEFSNCNWVLPVDDAAEYCRSCCLTDVIPDTDVAGNLEAWNKIEEAKRRLIFNLNRLGLRPEPKTEENPDGLSFLFMADEEGEDKERVLTGHSGGVVTLNIVEADDVERERARKAMGEPYRTLVGHLRHEVGHYYWDELVNGDEAVKAFRELFGDESEDYGDALKEHYKKGPPKDWPSRHISAYASSHAWEDWAETWAHYLHMMDSLGTAFHMRIQINATNEADAAFNHEDLDLKSFDSVISHWPAVAVMINSFNRSLGMPDAYPFVIPQPVVEKLRFIHESILQHQGDTP